jgi:arabinogalactan oligomer/maltooligosaccharide transport system permease protein
MSSLTVEVINSSLSQVGSMMLYIFLGALIVEVVVYLVFGKIFKSKYTLPYMLLAAAAIGLALLVIYPMAYEVRLAFTNMSLRHFRNYSLSLAQGIKNFRLIFTEPVLKQIKFLPLLSRTILWTIINLIFHVSGGLVLAILLNRRMRGRGIYRTLLVFPWAIPQIVAVLAWRGEFHFEYGFINVMLKNIGLQPIQWMVDPFWNFAAACITNIWLGIPFMMIIILGGLQSIPLEFYDAAEIDGASNWQQFRSITLPMLRPILTPAVILGTIWTFNNFNVPYMINKYELETSDILVTALFRAAFEYNRYGFSAAFALVILLILFVFTLTYIRVTGGVKGVYE